MTISAKVSDNLETLRQMDQIGLTAWAKANGMDSRSGFANFKKALLANGINYDALRAARLAEKTAAAVATVKATITLFSDAKAKNDRYGICNHAGEPVWYGRFFSDRDYNGEQSSGEMAAAKKAVWLASKVAEHIGGTVRLILKVDAEWLTYANAVAAGGREGGKARQLGEMAQRLGVVLQVEHVAGVKNPADRYTICDGFLKWQDGIAKVAANAGA